MPNQGYEEQMKTAANTHTPARAQRLPIPAFTPSPINISTPPVRIIDSEPRLARGHCLEGR